MIRDEIIDTLSTSSYMAACLGFAESIRGKVKLIVSSVISLTWNQQLKDALLMHHLPESSENSLPPYQTN